MIANTIKGGLRLIGKIVRQTGQTMDSIGIKIQGKYAPIEKLPLHKRVFTLNKEPFPPIANHVFISPSSTVVGNVEIGRGSSVWYGSIIRGDLAPVKIGENTVIGDRCIIRASSKSITGTNPLATKIGNNVVIGHGVLLHGCTIEDNAVVEMGSIVLDGAVISKNAILGASSLLKEGDVIPPGELWSGSPAQFQRKLSEEEIEEMYNNTKTWNKLSDKHDEYHTLNEQEREEERLLIYNADKNERYKPERHF